MSNISSVAASPPVTGITRDCDLVLDTNTGAKEIGTAYSIARNLRTSVNGSVNAIGIVQSSVAVAIKNGLPMPAVSSGLGNGAAIQYGIPIYTDHTLAAFHPASYSLRRGVTRIVSTLFADTAETPNNDVGMQAVIGGATLCELLPNTGATAGKTGFGIWMLGGLWKWATKQPTDPANTLSDTVTLIGRTNGNVDCTVPTQVELRIFDAAGGTPSATNNARVEVWIENIKRITRYWTNPTGVSDPVLPPMNFALYPQIRNTSTGPAHAYFADFCLIHGPNNAGTLSDV